MATGSRAETDIMDKGIHFISGLPRSGSTLLSALLRQNRRFHASMTSPVGSLVMTLERTPINLYHSHRP
jgi:hypothetical protein